MQTVNSAQGDFTTNCTLLTLQAASESAQSAGSLSSDMHSMKEVGQLVLKLSQAGKDGNMFKLFAKHVSELVPELTHLRCADHSCFWFEQVPSRKSVRLSVSVLKSCCDCSVLLLPGAKQCPAELLNTKGANSKSGSSKDKQTGKLQQPARLDWQQHAGSNKLSKAEAAKRAQLTDPELSSWQNADCQTNPSLPGTL